MGADLTSPRDRWVLFLGIAVLSLALLELATALTPAGPVLAFCPLHGVLFVALVRTARARWLESLVAVLAGVVAFALVGPDRGLAQCLRHFAPDAAATCIAAWVIQRSAPDGLSLGRLRDVVLFVGVVVFATFLSGVGAAALMPEAAGPTRALFRSVWSSDLLGAFAVAPALLTLSDGRLRSIRANRRTRRELVALLAAIVAVTYATYHATTPFPLPRGFPALLLVWTAFRFGPRGSAFGMALMTVTVLCAVASGQLAVLPSLGTNPNALLWELQGFLSLSFVTVLVLAALSEERAVLIDRLEGEVRVLRGLLPICAHCKKIRDDAGDWHVLERYLQRHTEATFTHGICPTCMTAHFGEGLDREP